MNYDVIITSMCSTNTYILHSGNSAIIVDPGDDARNITEYLDRKSLIPKFILITHNHFDHVGAVARLKSYFTDIKIYAPRIDYKLLKDAEFICDCFAKIPVEPFDVDFEVGDGDEFTILDSTFKVISTPGHTHGGVCYIIDGKTILTGDTLFRRGVGRTDLPGGDAQSLRASIKRLYELDGDYAVLPGHGEPTTLQEERDGNPYVRRNP